MVSKNGQLKSPAVLHGRGEVEEQSFLWFRTSSVRSWNVIRAADSGPLKLRLWNQNTWSGAVRFARQERRPQREGWIRVVIDLQPWTKGSICLEADWGAVTILDCSFKDFSQAPSNNQRSDRFLNDIMLMVWKRCCFQEERRRSWMISQLNANMFNPSLFESYLPQARNSSSTLALARQHSCLYTRARAVTVMLTWPADDATTPATAISSVLFSIASHHVCNIQFPITWTYLYLFLCLVCQCMFRK